MPDPVDSPGSSGSSSFNPYTTPATEDQTNGASRAFSRTTEPNSIDNAYRQGQPGHGGRGGRGIDPNDESMETYRVGRMDGLDQYGDQGHRKRKRSTTPEGMDYRMGSDSMERIHPDFQGGRNHARPVGLNGSESISPDGMHSPSGMPIDRSNLPGELWQHVFTFVPPESLGCLLQVNRTFKFLLTANDTQVLPRSPTHGASKYQSTNSIWSTSRKSFHSGMPRPLSSLTELEMWKLVRGSVCQFCGKSGSPTSSATTPSPLDKNTQHTDVRIVWPFGVRLCVGCLEENSEKVRGLLISL